MLDQHNGITVTIDGIAADPLRVVLFYSIHTNNDKQIVKLDNPTILGDKGEKLQAMYSISCGTIGNSNVMNGACLPNGYEGIKKGNNSVLRGTIDIGQITPNLDTLDAIIFQTKVNDVSLESPQSLNDVYQIRVPIDHSMYANKIETKNLDQSIQVEGQQIQLGKMMISPLRTSVEVRFDLANTKQIFDQVDMHIADDQGKSMEIYRCFYAR